MSAIEKCEAVVLHITPYSQTSHIVAWLSPSHGRFHTLVKGACRPRSVFLGQYDLFYTCELLFYVRRGEGLFIAKECTPLAYRVGLRENWRAALSACYVCDLVFRLTGAGVQTEIYSLLNTCLDFLCTEPPRLEIILWFELRLARLLGFLPRLSNCAVCNGPVNTERTVLFSTPHGGILCPRCSADESSTPIAVRPDILSTLRRWSTSESCAAVAPACTRQQALAIEMLLGVFYAYHLGENPESRRIVLKLLQRS